MNTLKISTKGRYGIRLMLTLALNDGNGNMPLKEIAKEQGISEKYLEQIINPLTKNGLVKSFRGSQGGYSLSMSADKITVGQILRILEGSLSPVSCVDDGCEKMETCSSISLWNKIKESVDNVVDNYTLQDMVDEYNRKNSTLK